MTKRLFLLIVIAIIIVAGGWYLKTSLTIGPSIPDTQQPPLVIVGTDLSIPVTSPLTITGTAIGPWYFEASFPVELYDSSNNLLAQAPAQAQSDWMTEDYVPFSVTLTFVSPGSGTGTLVLRKDNPSGEPANDASITLPVIF